MSPDAQIVGLLRQIDSFSKRDWREIKAEMRQSLDSLEGIVTEHGLDENALLTGYELALGGRLGTQHALRLLPLLLPRAPLGLRPVALTISVLGEAAHSLPLYNGKLDYKVQRRALGQLVVLLELGAVGEEGRAVLDRLFGVIERGLQYRMLREPTAALLCLTTRRHHVQPHRIDEVQALLHHDASPPASLSRLLEEYRSYEPERVYQSRKRASGRRGHSKTLDAWKDTAAAVFEGGQGATADERQAKRRKTSELTHIPLPTTYTTDGSARTETTLSDLRSIAELGNRVDKVALPSQAASVLSSISGATRRTRSEGNRIRLWGFLLRSGYENDSEHLARLSHWLVSQLSYELHDLDPSEAGKARIEDLLCRVREVSELGGELVEALEPFLAEYLLDWDGEKHRRVVFGLVALLKPFVSKDLMRHFLDRLRVMASTAGAEWNADLVACLASLVRNLAVRDSWDPKTPVTTAFGELDDGAPYLDALHGILRYVDEVILSAIQRFPESLVLRSAALSFHETALTLPLELDLPVVIVPSPAFIYLCLLAPEVMSLSRICGIIARLREALTGAASAITRGEEGSSPELVAELNERVIDTVNILWQKKFLSVTGMGLPEERLDPLRQMAEQRGQQVGSCLSLTTHGALALLARDCLSVLAQQHNKSADALVGPVTLSSLRALSKDPAAPSIAFNEFRPRFVEFLDEKGAKGLSDFLFSSLQSLVTRRTSGGGT
ncbi:hypothetical protein JCM3770_004367 [Rhodotorula araucariae]